jgi:TBPIP/Hop2 winged helix domain
VGLINGHHALLFQMSNAGGSKANVFHTVKKWLKDVNRPYSLNDVWEKGAKEFTKSAVQK